MHNSSLQAFSQYYDLVSHTTNVNVWHMPNDIPKSTATSLVIELLSKMISFTASMFSPFAKIQHT